MKANTNITPLSEITHGLFSGYSFRGKVSNDPKGNIRVIQMKDMVNNYTAIGDDCVMILSDKVGDKHLLINGDILIVAKGLNNYAVVFNQYDNVKTIASSAFIVVRLNFQFAMPEYVSWYINQKDVQHFFKQRAQGGSMTSINRKTIENIQIMLPNLEIQHKAVSINKLALKEKNLLNEIVSKRSRMVETALVKMIKNNKNEN